MSPETADAGKESLFWADQIAGEIISRKKFHFTDDKIPKFNKYVVKTSASISGVLHIGRLSDTIRGESVVRALTDRGARAEFIWVAEDMDPLRSIPKGVPAGFEDYIGMPVTDIPDPFGCHRTYAEHHTAKYFEVLGDFVSVRMTRYSTREEYKKGSFRPYIRKILDNIELARQIQDKYREEPLPVTWSPWKPVCDNCGKIITTSVKSFEGGRALYRCEDYDFEKRKAKGCGHEGENDPLKGNGKLVWKGEWAAEWAFWKVCSEGAGKEYQVPNSAWWVNGEIVERVLGYPMPVPIFYEHLIIDGEKMSASKGNIVYPADWLKVATPELLKFFYNKRIMKTRSFSWGDLPKLYDDYDMHESVFYGKTKVENDKEREHMKRLYAISQLKAPGKMPARVPFDFAAAIAQIACGKDLAAKGIEVLKRTGHISGSLSESDKKALSDRLMLARNWADMYAPDRYKFIVQDRAAAKVDPKVLPVIRKLAEKLGEKELKEEELMNLFYGLCKENGVNTKDFFRSMYNILVSKDYGPRLAPFILSIGREKISKLLKEAKAAHG